VPNPARTLETDPRWLTNGLAEVCAAAHVVADPVPFLRDAKAAHQLLDLVVLTACFLDRIEEDGDAGAPLKIQAATLRDAIAPWVPIPEALAAPISYGAWVGRIMGLQDTVLHAAPISPDGLSILRDELREAILAQECAEEQLRLARADADHLREQLGAGGHHG
jgi:hypothetical protein